MGDREFCFLPKLTLMISQRFWRNKIFLQEGKKQAKQYNAKFTLLLIYTLCYKHKFYFNKSLTPQWVTKRDRGC